LVYEIMENMCLINLELDEMNGKTTRPEWQLWVQRHGGDRQELV